MQISGSGHTAGASATGQSPVSWSDVTKTATGLMQDALDALDGGSVKQLASAYKAAEKMLKNPNLTPDQRSNLRAAIDQVGGMTDKQGLSFSSVVDGHTSHLDAWEKDLPSSTSFQHEQTTNDLRLSIMEDQEQIH